jgi:ribosomal protein S17E
LQYICEYEELIKILKDSYQFENDINLLGNEYINYSSIEYLKIYEPFGIIDLEWVKKEGEKYYEKFINKIEQKQEQNLENKIEIVQERKQNLENKIDITQYEKQEKIYTDDDTVLF